MSNNRLKKISNEQDILTHQGYRRITLGIFALQTVEALDPEAKNPSQKEHIVRLEA